MKEAREELRLRFYRKANEPFYKSFKQYTKWLENLAIEELRKEIIKENRFLREEIQDVINTLQEAEMKRL